MAKIVICKPEIAPCKCLIISAMRLLLLLPNFVLMAISGYNLTGNDMLGNKSNYFSYTLLHVLVMLICLGFVVMIIKSAFTIEYTETEETLPESGNALNTAHI